MKTRTSSRHRFAVASCALGALFLAHAADAAVTFNEDFTSTNYSSAITVPGTYSQSGSVIYKNNTGSRSYVKTVATDFNTVDFSSILVYNYETATGGPGFGSPMVFFGLGGSATDSNGEPSLSAYILELGGLESYSRPTTSSTPQNLIGNGFGTAAFPGANAARITKVGNIVTFEYDGGYNGTFTPDAIGPSFDLSTPAFSYLTSSNTALFFGTQGANARFESFSASVVPEPATYALLLMSVGIVLFLRRRRAMQAD